MLHKRILTENKSESRKARNIFRQPGAGDQQGGASIFQFRNESERMVLNLSN